MGQVEENGLLRLDLTLDPAMNVALDDALIEAAENAVDHPEVLRFWELGTPMVVIGRSSPLGSEVNHAYCERHSIPVFRRISGGQSIVTGPGCLMFALLLDMRLRPELEMLDLAHQSVMQNMQRALAKVGVETKMEGTCDLTIDGRKFSGNAVRKRRHWMLYHGTVLCDFDLSLISNCLGEPARRPEYRGQRSHDQFVTCVAVSTQAVADAIAERWDAKDPFDDPPLDLARQMVSEKYATRQWLEKVK